jgi:hypothetical protein
MSDVQEPRFDDSVRLAADALVERHGLKAAIAELQQRREAGAQNSRINEALAYLRRQEAER